ncbi:MAG: NUDIX hydrolase [Theionarchaea archaeon]|nr:NUDIX hydrolase [Theionarchaea archaeon]
MRINVAVDAVIVHDKAILLIRRGKEPFRGYWALPGGFVEYGETTEQAVLREAKEETNLNCSILRLVGVYSDPQRDPRGHTISIVYQLSIDSGQVMAGDDAAHASWVSLTDLPHDIAFDHAQIIQDALQ